MSLSLAAMSAEAVEVFLDDFNGEIAWPDTGDVRTGDDSQFPSNERAGSDPFTLSQTFQVDSTFDLNSIFIPVRNKLIDDISVGLQIFEVPDVNSLTLPTAPSAGDILLDTTFGFPSTNLGTENGLRRIAQIVLDTSLQLPATSGSAGYALRLTDNDASGEMRWYRTSGGDGVGPTVGNQYDFGRAYENSNERSNRDFGLLLSTVGAPMPPTEVFSVQTGDASDGSTWDTGLPPAPNFLYNVSPGDTVTVDSATFLGEAVVVKAGGTLDFAVDAANLKQLTVEAGGDLTASVSGTFGIGDINASPLMTLDLQESINLGVTAGSDFFLDVDLSGTGDIDFASNGSGSDLFLTSAGQHDGVIRFNGTGDEVRVVDFESFSSLEMNSTGANRLFLSPVVQADGQLLVFNEPGEVVHAAVNERRQGASNFEANADVTIDLSTDATDNELRFRVGSELRGAGNLTVVGTASAPLGVIGSAVVSLNEFEIGISSEPEALPVNPYSGTIAASDFANVEVFNSLPNAKIAVSSNAVVDIGHRAVDAAFSIEVGEIEVGDGGTLIVGFSETNTVEVGVGVFEAQDTQHAHTLRLTSSGTRDGSLSLASGSTTVMQINGTGDGEFDKILAQGDVSVGGTLEIVVNPADSDGEADNPVYAPVLGDTFDLIAIAPETTDGDYDNSGAVDIADYQAWKDSFGSTEVLAADGNGDGVVDAADYTIWRDSFGDSGVVAGAITGSIALSLIDPDGVFAAAGLGLQLNVTSTLVQLEVVAAGSLAAVPEPTGLALAALAGAGLRTGRRRS